MRIQKEKLKVFRRNLSMNLSKIEKSKVSFICMLPKIPKISSGNYRKETTGRPWKRKCFLRSRSIQRGIFRRKPIDYIIGDYLFMLSLQYASDQWFSPLNVEDQKAKLKDLIPNVGWYFQSRNYVFNTNLNCKKCSRKGKKDHMMR